MARGLAAHAAATARAAVGRPSNRATAAYEYVSPGGIARNVAQTRH